MEETPLPLGERIHRKITYLRVPLLTLAGVALVSFLHDIRWFWIGAPIAILGEIIQMWAASHLHKDEHLAVSGPYAFVRNPMYIGRFFLGLGFFVMSANPYLIAFYVLFFVVYVTARVRREERRLAETFGEEYADYCTEIGGFWPQFTPYSKSNPRPPSWTQVCTNHEEINFFGLIVVLIAVYLRIEYVSSWWLRP